MFSTDALRDSKPLSSRAVSNRRTGLTDSEAQNEQIRRRDRRPGSAAFPTARSVAIIHEYKRIYRWRV